MKKKLFYFISTILFLLLFSKGVFSEKRELRLEGEYLESSGSPYFEVRYRAQTKIPVLCQDFHAFNGGNEGEIEEFQYLPETSGSHYEITIPLDEKRWSFICDFQPYLVKVEKRELFNVTPKNITFVKEPNMYEIILETKLISQNRNSYHIDFGKWLLPEERTLSYKKRKWQEKKIAMVPITGTKDEMKFLYRMFIAPYIKTYHKIPDTKTGQQLLYHEDEIPADKYPLELGRKILFRDGYPLDRWSNPFQYRAQRVNGKYSPLFSLGSDGIKSSDDIELKKIQDPLGQIQYYKHIEKMKITAKRLSLVSQIFKAYIKVHKKAPTQEVGDAFLRLEGNFTPYIGKGISQDYVQKLKETIPYKNGYPMDAWNNRFRYKAAIGVQASVYSTGEDGLDNGKGLRKSLPSR